VRKNESGVTLVELLAVLVLISIVTAIIWNTVFISMRHNTTETKKLRLQQEANYVIAEIQQYHRQCDSYRLTIKGSEVSMKDCVRESSNSLPDLTISNGFQYKTSDESAGDEPLVDEFNDTTIDSKDKHSSLSFILIIEDTENKNLKVEIPTNIYRYKSQGPIGGE